MLYEVITETEERIWCAVHELGYVPNQNARKLVRNEINDDQMPTRAIGCIFTSTQDSFNDPFFSMLARGVQEEASKRGYILGYSFSSTDLSHASLYNNMAVNRVDGAVIMGRFIV